MLSTENLHAALGLVEVAFQQNPKLFLEPMHKLSNLSANLTLNHRLRDFGFHPLVEGLEHVVFEALFISVMSRFLQFVLDLLPQVVEGLQRDPIRAKPVRTKEFRKLVVKRRQPPLFNAFYCDSDHDLRAGQIPSWVLGRELNPATAGLTHP